MVRSTEVARAGASTARRGGQEASKGELGLGLLDGREARDVVSETKVLTSGTYTQERRKSVRKEMAREVSVRAVLQEQRSGE